MFSELPSLWQLPFGNRQGLQFPSVAFFKDGMSQRESTRLGRHFCGKNLSALEWWSEGIHQCRFRRIGTDKREKLLGRISFGVWASMPFCPSLCAPCFFRVKACISFPSNWTEEDFGLILDHIKTRVQTSGLLLLGRQSSLPQKTSKPGWRFNWSP